MKLSIYSTSILNSRILAYSGVPELRYYVHCNLYRMLYTFFWCQMCPDTSIIEVFYNGPAHKINVRMIYHTTHKTLSPRSNIVATHITPYLHSLVLSQTPQTCLGLDENLERQRVCFRSHCMPVTSTEPSIQNI